MNPQRPSLDAYLERELHAVRRRLVARQFAIWTGALWVFQAFLIWLVADALSTPLNRTILVVLLSCAGLLAVLGALQVRRWSAAQYRSRASLAKALENRFPELDSRLYAVAARDDLSKQRLGFLEDQVTREVLVLARRQYWPQVVPGWHLLLARLASLIGLTVAVAASIALVFAPFTSPAVADRADDNKRPTVTSAEDWQVSPGDTELERGRSLLVTVRLPAPSPDPLELVIESSSGESARFALSQNLSDPIYSTQLPNLQESLRYRVESSRSSTRDFRVDVYELPQLEELNVELQYPEFTRLSPKLILDPRRVQAVEGTDLVMTARFNQPLQHARWESPSGTLNMTAVNGEPGVYTGRLTVRQSEKLDLAFASVAGRAPAAPTSLRVTALPNQPPEIRWMQPGIDPQVSPLEEVDVAGRATDDFGVTDFGLTFQLVGREPIEIRLGQSESETAKAVIRDQVTMESLQVKPGDLMQLYLWAEDRVEGGQTRRALSDLLVAEVRDFEQIFRQSDQPNDPNQGQPSGDQPGMGEGGQEQAQNLIERQKQVLLASWNLLRRNAEQEGWSDDLQLVLEQQMAIIDEIRPLLQQVPESDFPAEEKLQLERAMVDAVNQLLEGVQQQQNTTLRAATEAQQVILQSMMRLVSNEFDVQQQQQQSGQQSSPSSSRQAGSPSQQQLQQLQLDDDRNRYEQESQAQTITDPEQERLREQLNRLGELARRQEDLNEQIKELQAELEAAESEEEAQELRRRLERLREEQERLLRDAEQLQEDLAEDPNASQEDRQQLEQARESAQQSAQALANENIDQALAEGRRAEQALDQLRDEIQQRAGDAFQEELNRLNRQLEDLAQSQQEVENRLDRFFNDDTADLRDRDRTTPLKEQMEQRSDGLEQVLNDLKEVIEASEASEPLLSDELYEAFRDAKQQQLERMADDSKRWVENGLPERSVPLENELSERLQELQQSVQRSSEFAGNDEISALRMAEARLRELAAEADPSENGQQGDRQEGEAQSSDSPSDTQSPMGQSPEGQSPMGQSPEGQSPMGQSPEGQSPMGQSPEGQSPMGQSPEGQSPMGQSPEGQSPMGQSPEGQSPMGQSPEGQSPMGQSPEGQSPMGQSPEGQNPMGQSPEGQSPMGQSPEGQSPMGQSPEGQSPMGQSPEGQSPMGQSPEGQSPMGQSPEGQSPMGQSPEGQSPMGGTTGSGNPDRLSADQLLDRWSDSAGPLGNPLTGDNYRDWTDRLQEVEDLVPTGPLREEATRIRQRAAEMRRNLQRHSEVPDPQDIEEMIVKPLDSLARRVAAERSRLEGSDPSIRLDRDPIPSEFADEVREYFQRLGAGRE